MNIIIRINGWEKTTAISSEELARGRIVVNIFPPMPVTVDHSPPVNSRFVEFVCWHTGEIKNDMYVFEHPFPE